MLAGLFYGRFFPKNIFLNILKVKYIYLLLLKIIQIINIFYGLKIFKFSSNRHFAF